jgi:FG-GAP-like repeat/FG-GAP repeat
MARPVRTLTIAALALGLLALIAGGIGAQTARGALGQPDSLSFAAPREIALGHYTGAMIAGKFNGGPKADLAILNDTPVHDRSGTLTIVRDVNGHFRLVRTVAMRSFTSSVVTGDVNGNGRLDLVLGTPESWLHSQPSMSVLLGAGNGTFATPRVFSLSTQWLYGEPLLLADLNGDHRLDVVTAAHKWVVVLLGRGDGTFAARHSYLGDTELGYGDGAVAALAVGDVNGDGRPDVVAGGQEGVNLPEGTVNVLLGNGRGGLGRPTTTITDELLPGGMALTDANGDGKLDLVVNNDVDTPDYGGGPEHSAITVSLGDGAGAFTQAHRYDLSGIATASAFRDLNGDGVRDAAVVVNGVSGFDVLLGDGAGGLEDPFTIPHTPWKGGSSLAVADFNGDGRPDVAVNGGKTLSVFLNTTTIPTR